MADTPRRPLLNPVLRFTKDPRPEGVSGGGKNRRNIRTDRLPMQRRSLSEQFTALGEEAEGAPRFNGRAIVYASMFDDSLAPSWTPDDLFRKEHGGRLITPYKSGYLVEVETQQLLSLARRVRQTDTANEMVDISRIEAVRFFGQDDATRSRSLSEIWEAAPETKDGRAFVVWLMPLNDRDASEHLLQAFSGLRDGVIAPPPSALGELAGRLDTNVPAVMRRSLRTVVPDDDRLNLAMREYRQKRHSRTTVIVPGRSALSQLVASGTVFRIEPVPSITTTAPGDGQEPNRPLPSALSDLPIVGVVDGGLSAVSYKSAEAWKAPPLVPDSAADTKHGNWVTSLVVQGHDWNNNLSLPALYCQVGTVQAVAKRKFASFFDPQDLISYLDGIMMANPETRIWNFSFNELDCCDLECVSYLGHEISVLARKHDVLPIISVGNKPGEHLKPPADCEAAITIGGRLHNADGEHGDICTVSHSGPGPSSMLKPELSHFSNVRVIGGVIAKGSSFATALTSPLAAHTMARLREPTADMVKALMLHHAEGDRFDPAFGFGSPGAATLPWECRPGFVTLQWRATLRPGAAYYWELPIPPALRSSGKLKGFGALTAVLNPHPMVSDFAGPNYFSIRLATALQCQRGGKNYNLLGSLETDKIAEEVARAVDHKWSPVRHHRNEFKRGVSFDGDNLYVYARVYARDLYLYGYRAEEIPEMDTAFVLSLGTGNEEDDVYNQLRDQLGAFVETATIETDIDVDAGGD
ncbi:S8 family serine peptidase [Amorphus sp. 3PC139-8]|uniref:S8 family serine peptidase n=1 Tax=Amorphus sp. 3PC139-8 TaxID=2735676 RepID=UPI00345C7011